MPEVTSTFFGLTIAFVMPGLVGLYSLTYWFASASKAFHTFLNGKANFGLMLFLLVAALAFGVAVSAVRWLIFEEGLCRWMNKDAEWSNFHEQMASYRFAVEETYRYHQAYGGLVIAAPAVFVGWLRSLDVSTATTHGLIAGFVAVELILLAGAINSYSRYLNFRRRALT